MTFTFTAARRRSSRLILALIGPSGSGKTYSALRLATGIVRASGGAIAVIDTEGHEGRSLKYAPPGGDFEFGHVKLDPPFAADRYREAFEAAEAYADGGVVIIDSCSAEHEDQGGALEQHAELTGGVESKNMQAWGKIRPAQRRLLARLTHASCHVICCFRADDKTGVGQGGKPIHLGWQAVGWKKWPYEMEMSVLLSIHNKGVPIVQGFDWGKLPRYLEPLVPLDRALDEDVGRALAEWSMGQDDSTPSQERRTSMVTLRIGAEERQAAIGTAAKDLAGAVQQAGSKDDLDMLVKDNAVWIEELRADWRERLDDVIAEARERVG